jgi:hypothetical protein
MKVRHTYLIKGDIALNFIHHQITALPGKLTELYESDDHKWYLRKVGGIEEISNELALQILEGSKEKRRVNIY